MAGFMRAAAAVYALFMVSMTGADVTGDDWVAQSDAISLRVLQGYGEFIPEDISAVGLEPFDDDIIDLGKKLFERRQASITALRQYVESQREGVEDPRVLQDLDILDASLADDLETFRVEHDALLPWHDIPALLFDSFQGLLDPRNDPARHDAALVRLEKYTGAAAGYVPLVQLARERTEERFDIAGLAGPYRGEVQRALDNLPAQVDGMRELFAASQLVDWEPEFSQLESQLASWADWTREDVLPRARADHRLPAVVYANNLKDYGVHASPDRLIRTGQFAYQEIHSQMRTVARRIAARRGWDEADLATVIARLKERQIPPDRVLGVYRERLAAIEAIIRRENIITLPQRPAGIRLATDAESANSPAPFMSPPQLVGNTGQYGEFVLVTRNPALKGAAAQMDDWSHDGMTWAVTVHEARPGHELQFAALVENGTSLARALFAFNSANVEGWGLYAEAIMLEYLPDEGQLFTLLARLQRAARMFLDPMINLGQLDPEQAVTFMIEEVGLSEAMARSEADRFTFRAPGQATSYFYGYMNLMRLRTETELALGDRFNARAFHDFVLSQGLLPPEGLRRAVNERFIASTTNRTSDS
ncbi:DUF885 domain-containing protein [Marinihelvus fidelis]|nr:DUF885 domain-containing protein [Marinihelvus fidelis]